MSRIDAVLVAQGLAESRAQAQRFISDGRVRWHNGHEWQVVRKASMDADVRDEIELAASDTDTFVSRAGMKLAGALAHTGLDVAGWRVLDLGTSTGGFADCLLQAGAACVVGVDVGHGQLHARLQDESRLWMLEGCNARYLDADGLAEQLTDWAERRGLSIDGLPSAHDFDLVVADLSFISLTKVLPILAVQDGAQSLLLAGGHVLFLVKPQFELDAQALSKAGIVKDPARYADVQAAILSACLAAQCTVLDYFASPITGGDGHHEFFVWAQFAPSE